jgi:predicted dehydrogenase
MGVSGNAGYAIIVGPGKLRARYKGEAAESQITAASLAYLAGVLNGQLRPDGDLSSLETNLVVMRMLDAGRASARTGRKVSLSALPGN